MHTIHRDIKTLTLAILTALIMPSAQAELDNESWIVRSGDGLYGIARQLAPKDLKMQARIRSEITQLNPRVNPETLEVGMSLKLPGFLFKKPEPTPAVTPARLPEPPAAMQISKPAIVTPDPLEIIGKVVIQSGTMMAENRGNTRPLNRTASILKGDTLKTADNARSQIRLKDGALIAISPGTELKFEDFAYNGSEDGTERSVINLIKGGFRTITGAIGHVNKQNYQVKTSIATIGIRGTHYGLMLCEGGSCQNNAEAGNLSDGLYGGVVDGSIVTNNDSGQATFNNDQYFHIQSAQSLPIETLLPPPIFNDTQGPVDPNNTNMANGSKPADPNANQPGGPGPGPGSKDGMMAGNFQFIRNPMMMDMLRGGGLLPPPGTGNFNPNQPPPIDAGQNLPQPAPFGSGLAISLTQFDQSSTMVNGVAAPIIVADTNKNKIFLEQQNIGGQTINNLPFAIHEEHDDLIQTTVHQTHDVVRLRPDGTGAVYENLGGSSLGVNWGRWHGNYILTESQSDINSGIPYGIAHDVYAHFIYSDRITQNVVALSGLKTRIELYSYFGGTVPTLTSYTTGVFNAAPISLSPTQPIKIDATMDFVSLMLMDYQLAISDSLTGEGWQASLVSPVSFADIKNNSFNLTGMTTSEGSLNGQASLIFIGDQAGAAMTSYALWYQNLAGTIDYGLNGVAVLAPPGMPVPNNSVGLFASAGITAQMSFAANMSGTSRDNVYTAMFLNDPAVTTDDVNAPVLAISNYTSPTLNTTFTANPSQAMATQNATTLAGATINWGHWDTANISVNAIPVTTGMTHFIGSNSVTTLAQLGGLTTLGSLNYAISGSSVDANFNGASVPAANVAVNMTFDFVSQNMTAYDATVSGAGTVSGYLHVSNPIAFTAMSQSFNLVDSAGCTGCLGRGNANVQLTGNQAEGAITSFALSDGTNTAAGVALLAR